MSDTTAYAKTPLAAPLLALAGLALAVVAWMLPANLKSLSPALLRAAGAGTPSLSDFGGQLVESEKIGPAELVLEAARQAGDPGAGALDKSVQTLAGQQGELVAWGGWDPFLDPLFEIHRSGAPAKSTPALTFFLPQKARDTLRSYLENSRSQGVLALLGTRTIGRTGLFVPATQPGGQPLDAVILLSALLYQGEHLSSSLQRELHALADTANRERQLGGLEPFYIDLLSLSQRLNWVQLSELLRRTEDTKTVGEYAHLARVAPKQLPEIYAAALFSNSADQVANYLIRYGRSGAEDLRLALRDGQGAVRQLMLRQVPVNRERTPTLSEAAWLVLWQPKLALALKYFGYVLGVFLVFRGLDRMLLPRDVPAAHLPRRMQSGVLALLFAGLIVLATEPHLLQAAPLSEYRFKIVLPLLANSATPPVPATVASPAMSPSTIISIGIFAVLQVATYLICLRKLAEIYRQDLPARLKLRLIENEDNLFDSGLYVGMMGTATALVLQVLGIIDPNLLAAYSSNLFGLICVALVKIRHVRGFKRRLILELETAAPAMS